MPLRKSGERITRLHHDDRPSGGGSTGENEHRQAGPQTGHRQWLPQRRAGTKPYALLAGPSELHPEALAWLHPRNKGGRPFDEILGCGAGA